MSLGSRRVSRRLIREATIDYGQNLLSGKMFSSNAGSSSGFSLANLTDGNASTRWVSNVQSPATLTVNLGAVYNLTKIVGSWAADCTKDYTIQISSDNTNWTTIASGTTNGTASAQTITTTSFSGAPTGQYLKFNLLTMWNASYGNSLYEIEAYGTYVSAGVSGHRLFADGATIKIMPLGDSIVEGMDGGAGGAVRGGWRYFLAQKLVEGDKQTQFVGDLSDISNGVRHYDASHERHSGHSGWTIKNVSDNLNGWLNSTNPDVILIHCGGNDLFGEGLSAVAARDRMRVLIDKVFAYNANIHFFLTSNLQTSSYPQQIYDYNAMLPPLINTYSSAGRSAHFVDISAMVNASTMLPDGYHPADPGYTIMAQGWYDALIAFDES